MGSYSTEMDIKRPWIETPCIRTAALSRAAGCNIYIKLDNLQPSGSFKLRGIGNLVSKAAASRPPGAVHFYSSSGGNAGLACATAARHLGAPATIVVPDSTKPLMVAKLKLLGATVIQRGAHWAEADRFLRDDVLARDPAGIYVPPFDHPLIWEGNASAVDELARQLADAGAPVHGLVCSVGGGGLLCGLMQGVEAHRWPGGRAPGVLAVETRGAESLAASIRAGERVTLPGITSIASSLGAARVCERAWEYTRSPSFAGCVVVDDADAARACLRFADDCRFLVELACGASIAAVYDGHVREAFGKGLTDEEWREKNIVLEVCGGSAVTLEILEDLKRQFCL